MSKFTPGPWKSSVPRQLKHKSCRWIKSGTVHVAKVYGDSEFVKVAEETEANARLIATAPEMYDILVKIADHRMSPASKQEINDLMARIDGSERNSHDPD